MRTSNLVQSVNIYVVSRFRMICELLLSVLHERNVINFSSRPILIQSIIYRNERDERSIEYVCDSVQFSSDERRLVGTPRSAFTRAFTAEPHNTSFSATLFRDQTFAFYTHSIHFSGFLQPPPTPTFSQQEQQWQQQSLQLSIVRRTLIVHNQMKTHLERWLLYYVYLLCILNVPYVRRACLSKSPDNSVIQFAELKSSSIGFMQIIVTKEQGAPYSQYGIA